MTASGRPSPLPPQLRDFLDEYVARQPCLLALDYDGTLAPFRARRDEAVLPPDIRAALEALAPVSTTRLVIVSGRPVDALARLVALEPMPELWGAHGWEHLAPGMAPGMAPARTLPAPEQIATLDREEAALVEAYGTARVERKTASVAIHWRGVDLDEARRIERAARDRWDAFDRDSGFEIRAFDGGVELRVAGHDKGDVVRSLRRTHERTPLLYLGDDDTDEDAFRVLCELPATLGVRVSDAGERLTLAAVTIPHAAVVTLLQEWRAATLRVRPQAT